MRAVWQAGRVALALLIVWAVPVAAQEDESTAKRFFESATEHSENEEHKKAFQLYQKACEAGSHDGCASVGVAYLVGQGVSRNVERGVSMLKKACNANTPKVCMVVGISGAGLRAGATEAGVGFPKDVTRGDELERHACDAGHANVCLAIGAAYAFEDDSEDDSGVPKDSDRARKFLKEACDLGNDDACIFIAGKLDEEPGGERMPIRP